MRASRISGPVAVLAAALSLSAAFSRDVLAQASGSSGASSTGGFDTDTRPYGRRRARQQPATTPRRSQSQSQFLPSQYGVAPGSGAGTTGFVSTNQPIEDPPDNTRPRRTRPPRAVARPATPADPRPPRPGSAQTGPSRPGASIELPPGTATPLIRRRRPLEEDPFDPVGIRVGSFLFKPAVETTSGFDSNPSRVAGGAGSAFVTVAPELSVRSQWSRHALDADLRGSYTAYEATPSLDRPYLDARINGRLDITRQTRGLLELRTNVSTTNPGSPDLPADLRTLPAFTTIGATIGVAHQFNRFEITGKTSIDRVTYANSELTDGSTVSNRDRNYTEYGGQLRAAYELTPGLKPFIEGAADHRARDVAVDVFGLQRESTGATGRVGTTFEFSRKLTGEISIGYLTRVYKDPTLKNLEGLIVDGSLIWTATALTTVKFTAKSTADETILPDTAGILRRDFGAQVDHAFRRWLIGTLRFGYGIDDYDGTTRKDERYVASAAITYKLNRDMQLKGEFRREWRTSNVPGNDYTANIALLGLRLQR